MNKPHHYMKAAESSRVGQRLSAYMSHCQEVENTARAWAEKHGATNYYESPDGMAGGVCAVEFNGADEREGWEKVGAFEGRPVFMPVPESELEKEMYALPVVSEMELISILELQPVKRGNVSCPMTFGDETPVLFLHHGYWYADLPYKSQSVECQAIDEKEFFRRKMAATNER